MANQELPAAQDPIEGQDKLPEENPKFHMGDGPPPSEAKFHVDVHDNAPGEVTYGSGMHQTIEIGSKSKTEVGPNDKGGRLAALLAKWRRK